MTALALGPQRLAAGGQDVHAGYRTKNFLGDGRDRLVHVLATIEDDELLAILKAGGKRADHIAGGIGKPTPQRCARYQCRMGERREVDRQMPSR